MSRQASEWAFKHRLLAQPENRLDRQPRRRDSILLLWSENLSSLHHGHVNLKRSATNMLALSFWNHLGFKFLVIKKAKPNVLRMHWRCFAENCLRMSQPKCSVRLLAGH